LVQMTDIITDDIEIFNIMMKLLEEERIITISGPEFILNRSFVSLLMSSFKQHDAATALALALKSYCPGLTAINLALAAAGVMKIFSLTKNKMYFEIKAQLDRDIPESNIPVRFMKNMAEEIKKENQKK